MNDDLYIGSAPAEEDCAQVGTVDYSQRARRECRALVEQLRRAFGPEPPGCRLYTKQNLHDFGTYLSVNCSFDPESQSAIEYAYRCEAELPSEWDAQARAYLDRNRTSGTLTQRKQKGDS
jgi:hypothetical protein